MKRPSRDQLGSDSFVFSGVRRRGVPPAAATTQISELPLDRESKAIHLPSGDQRGDPVMAPLMLVSLRRPVPPELAIQTSFGPVRVLRKATLDPSGENWGLEFSPLEAS